MRAGLLALGLCAVLASCEPGTDPEQHLTEKELVTLVDRLKPYVAPDRDTVYGHARLDDPDPLYYLEVAALAVDDRDTAEFLLYRQLAKPGQKPLAIVGKVYPVHCQADFAYYHEAFRTWEMQAPVLRKHAERLFDLYREGESLAPYENAAVGREWIELPNEYTHFSDEARAWVRDEMLD